MDNPIPFNPESLTIQQAKDGLDVLSLIFNGAERVKAGEIGVENLIFHIIGWRDELAKRWE